MIVRVHFGHGQRWYHVEFPHRSMSELHDDLCERGTVLGQRLVVQSGAVPAEKYILRRYPVIIGPAVLFEPAEATFHEPA